jgi:FkbM family methyltransferase
MLRIIIDSGFFQKAFSKIHQYTLKAMNYASSGDYKSSGELSVLNFIYKKNGNKAAHIFDVGANIGGYSHAIRSIFPSSAIIHAFEPSVATFKILVEKTKDIESLITNNKGLGESETKLTLFSDSEGSGLASLYNRKIEMKMDRTEDVDISTVDLYCEQKGVSDILFLKLDIEGHELSALKGASGMLRKKRIRFIQFEFGGTNLDSRTYFKDFYELLSNDYKIYRILKGGLFEIKKYSEAREVFLSVNYLAELRSN